MAIATKLYRFKIELSNVENSIYQSLDFRAAQHPSETLVYLITRALAYAICFEDGIEFSAAGLGDPDSPAIRIASPTGEIKTWIEIGNPAARRVHKASKAAGQVKIFTYKDPQVLLNDLASETIHRRSEIQIYSLPNSFLEQLAGHAKKENKWSVIYMDGTLTVSGENFNEVAELRQH